MLSWSKLRDNIMDTFWCVVHLSRYKNIASTCLAELLRHSVGRRNSDAANCRAQLPYTEYDHALVYFTRLPLASHFPCSAFERWALRSVFFRSVSNPPIALELNVSASVELTVELQVASFSGGCRYIKLYR